MAYAVAKPGGGRKGAYLEQAKLVVGLVLGVLQDVVHAKVVVADAGGEATAPQRHDPVPQMRLRECRWGQVSESDRT
jgi:hypothetical protein